MLILFGINDLIGYFKTSIKDIKLRSDLKVRCIFVLFLYDKLVYGEYIIWVILKLIIWR